MTIAISVSFMAAKTRYTFNLLGADAKLLARVKLTIENKLGVKVTTLQVIRMALNQYIETNKG